MSTRTVGNGPVGRAVVATAPPPHDARPLGGAFPASVRQQLPLFAAVGFLLVLTGLVPFPVHRTVEVVAAGLLYCGLVVAGLTIPWRRLPQWSWSAIPVGYVGVIALVHDAQNGSPSGLFALNLVPLVWIAFYGRRSEVLVGLGAIAAAMVIPIVVVGPPVYPSTTWRVAVIVLGVSALISFTVLSMVAHERSSAAELVEQSDLARHGAHQAERARQRLASLLAAATETAVVGFDEDARVTFFSTGAESLLGYCADEVVGRMSAYELFDHDQRARRQATADPHQSTAGAFLDAIGEKNIWTCRRKDGQRVQLATTVTAWTERTAGDDEAGFVVVATDVTQRERLISERERLLAVQREVTQVLVEQNQQLRELTQMKDDVVATVSHELRTPLTSIRGFVELLLDEAGGSLDDEQVQMLRAIDRNSMQLLKVADDLLADPGGGRGLRVEFVDTDLSRLAAEAVETMTTAAARRAIDLTLETSGPARVHGDPLRLHQLLGNLLSNAVKFTPVGGRVVVRVEELGPFVRLEVLDDGQGIPEDERAQLFDRFYRLASTSEQGIPGSGLGLAIAKSVVEAHNGTIQIVDLPGWSTAFRVDLPAAAPRGAAAFSPFEVAAAFHPPDRNGHTPATGGGGRASGTDDDRLLSSEQ